MGLESVCIEMSDPFGDDPTDFDQVNLARVRIKFYCIIFQSSLFLFHCLNLIIHSLS